MYTENHIPRVTNPIVDHLTLKTVFRGITHNESSHDVYEDDAISMWQFRGIKYGKIPARFMQAELNEEFENFTDYYHYGYIILSSLPVRCSSLNSIDQDVLRKLV